MKIIAPAEPAPPVRVEPTLTGRALVPYAEAPLPVPVDAPADALSARPSALRERVGIVDARHVSPRQIAAVSMDLYVNGALGWEEYAMLAFQPELHPDYEKTIGALTGEPAEPDRPRDFVNQWEARLSFELRYNADQPDLLARTERIVDVLKQLKLNTDISA